MKALALAVLVLAGCTTESDVAPYDLQIGGAQIATGFDLHVGLVDTETGEVLMNDQSFPFQRTATYGDLLEIDHTYDLHLFYDRDDDGACTATDYAWKQRLVQVADTIEIDLDAAATSEIACGYFER